MPRYKIAHINEQGQDMIIVPLDRNFDHLPPDQQEDAACEFQARASSAHLRGGVVVVWDKGNGRMGFIAPQPWHPFVRSINLPWVYRNLNRELYW